MNRQLYKLVFCRLNISTELMSSYVPSEDTLWEFSAPGYCDFSVPYLPLPDDGYFDPCLLENADGFDLYPAPPTPQPLLAPNTPASHAISSIAAPLSIPRSAARRVATPKTSSTTVIEQTSLKKVETTLSSSLEVNNSVQPPFPALSLLQEEDYADLKSPIRPIKGAWFQHVMAIAQNSASSSVVDSSSVGTSVEPASITTVSTASAIEAPTISAETPPITSVTDASSFVDIPSVEASQTTKVEVQEDSVTILTEIVQSPSLQIANAMMGTPRSPRVQVTAVLSAASSISEVTFDQAVIPQKSSGLSAVEEEINIAALPSDLGKKSSATSLLPVQFSFSPQLVKAVEDDSKNFLQETNESVMQLASLDSIDVNPPNIPLISVQSGDASTSVTSSSLLSTDTAPSKLLSSTQFSKSRVFSTHQAGTSQQQQKKASVPITSKASGVVLPPPISSSTTSSIQPKKQVAGSVTSTTTTGISSSSSSASSALAAFKQRTAALAAKVFASANAANASTQESRAPSGVAQFIASTSPVKKSAPTLKSVQASEPPISSAPPTVSTALSGQAGGARRVPKAEPASSTSIMSSAGVPPPAGVSAPLPGAGFVPVQQPATNFVPTALLLAKYESGVRDLVIPAITVGSSKLNMNAANKKTDVQPFTFATAGRANRRRSADASLAPAAMAAVAATASEGPTLHHKASSDAQQRTMSALAVKRSVARVPSSLHDSAIPPASVTSTAIHVESSSATSTHSITVLAPLAPSLPPSAPPSILVPHKLGEIPDAVKRAARIAQEERSAAESTCVATTHTAAPVLAAETSSAAGGGAQGRLERFHGLLNKMGRTLAIAVVPTVSNSSSSSVIVAAPTAKENIHAGKTRPLLALPTVAKSPQLHTKRRTLERAGMAQNFQ